MSRRSRQPDLSKFSGADFTDSAIESAACAERDARIAELERQLAEARQALEGWSNYDKWLWPESALEQAKKNTVAALASMQKG